MGKTTCSTAFLAVAMVALSACSECRVAPGLSGAQCTALEAMALPEKPPAARGNLVADDLDAAHLGHLVFFDARLSANQNVRCASCHVPEFFFADGKATSEGLQVVARNSPSVFGAAWHRWQMWDGRADSLWSQPLLAFENPKEMDFTRLELAHRVALTYRGSYEALFGALPPLDDAQRFPARGKPGDAAFDGMSAADQLEVNRVVANVGKCLEAYQRLLAFGPGRFDAFVQGDASQLDAQEREGARVFFAAGCDDCHAGALLSDDAFHAVGVPPAEGQSPERARAEGLELLARSPFNAAGVFFDGPKEVIPTATPEDEGAYRTPSLRNVARTGPWGHNGTFSTLEAAVDFHLPASVTPAERTALLRFLRALDAGDPKTPWNGWPNR